MSREIGIDLGTTNVLIHLRGQGIVLDEPSVVAVDVLTQEVIAIGQEAYEMMGRTASSIEVIYPLEEGVIANYELAEAMLILFLKKIHAESWFRKPNILICVPTNTSEVEQQALIDTTRQVFKGRVYIEEEPKIAGVGAGVDLTDPKGHMVIDIGGGTTDVAVLSGNEIVNSASIKFAGNEIDELIIQYFRTHHQMLIGKRSAEKIKIQLATAVELSNHDLDTHSVRGRDLISGLPASINVNSNQLLEAYVDELAVIARTVKQVLENTSPELSGDIMEEGILLTGGGAMIQHMDDYLSGYLGVHVITADNPLNRVAVGTGIMLEAILDGTFDQEELLLSQRIRRWFRQIRIKLFG